MLFLQIKISKTIIKVKTCDQSIEKTKGANRADGNKAYFDLKAHALLPSAVLVLNPGSATPWLWAQHASLRGSCQYLGDAVW